MGQGSLTVVGTGYMVAGQVTVESRTCIENADKLFFVVEDGPTKDWLRSINATAESLHDSYAPGKPRIDTYHEMVDRMLAPVRQGKDVCAAFYGHPGVFVFPGHEAVRLAREEGFTARMLPGISAEDCLFADLGVDPARHGCQSFEATDFLIHGRRFDPTSSLVLWQIGAIGVQTYEKQRLWSQDGIAVLVDVLRKAYPDDHEVIVYESAVYPVCDPSIQRVPLGSLARADVSVISTLYVPPAGPARVEVEMLERLGLPRPGS